MHTPTKRALKRTRAKRLQELMRITPDRAVYDCVIIGAGAAGSVAAISLAKTGASVCIIDKNTEIAHPILATGAGACNLSNTNLDVNCYNAPAFVKGIFGRRAEQDIHEFFSRLGLLTTQKEGRIYPLSMQAASVQQVLEHELVRADAFALLGHEVVELTQEQTGAWHIRARFAYVTSVDANVLEEAQKEGSTRTRVGAEANARADECASFKELRARTVIIATGTKHGLSFLPTDIANVTAKPTLCALACADDPILSHSGRRAQVVLTLVRAGKCVFCEAGEVLIRDFGLSGIVVFNASRIAQAGDILSLNFCPHMRAEALFEHIARFIDTREDALKISASAQTEAKDVRYTLLTHALCGIVDPMLAESVLKRAQAHMQRSTKLPAHAHAPQSTDNDARARLIQASVEALMDYELTVQGPAQTAHAQCWRGGIAREALNPHTLALQTHPSIWAIGEAVDVDAACGGYNLSWAWKSALVAAKDVAKALKMQKLGMPH